MAKDCTSLLVVGRSSSLLDILKNTGQFDFKIDAIISLGADSVEDELSTSIPVYSWGHNAVSDKVVDILGIRVLFAKSACDPAELPVDILISDSFDSPEIRAIGDQLTPWYHFVPGPYYESESFYSKGRGTRLISLEQVGSEGKWAHVVRMGPSVNPSRPLTGYNLYKPASSHPEDLIWGNPEPKRSLESTDNSRRNEKSNKKPKRACYMCLDSPSATQELLVATGSHVYLCTARGPIKCDEVSSKLNCAGHVLLTPKSHIPSIARSGKSEDQLELRKFEIALASMFRQYGLESATYEFVRDRTVHGHLQVVPIPQRLVDEALQQMKSALLNKGLAVSVRPPAGDYLAIRIGDRPSIFAQLPTRNVDLQLPRSVLCKVLGVS